MKKNFTPEAVVTGFDQRVDAMFRAESGKPLVRAKKQKPLDPGRGNYVRAYSYSMVGFAARCLYLNEMREEANAALAENAQHYLDNPLDINDRDSFHWHAEIVMRLIEMYGTNGSNLITKKTEALALEPIWEYVRKVSKLDKAEYEKSKTWHIYLPKKVFESPFLNAEWNSGVVTISKGTRKKILDFTKKAEDNPDQFLYAKRGNDPSWSSILEEKQIPIGTNSYMGITGSIIDVNNEVVEKGLHAFRPIEREINIHTLGNSLIPRRDFHKWSRWYQEDGNTQVFRLFGGEHNVRNARANAARIEAFSKKRWNRGTWHEWVGTYTIVKAQRCAIFQVKNNGEDWSIQLVMTTDGDVVFQPRRATPKTVLKNMEGKSFDVRIRDNGHTSECYINGEFAGRHDWGRPSGRSTFRWGMYVGGKKLSKDALLFVTGATVDPEGTPTKR